MKLRRGYTLVELACALTLIAAAATLLAQLLALIAQHERRTEQRMLARITAANLLATALAAPPAGENAPREAELPARVAHVLANAQAKIETQALPPAEASPALLQVTVTITFGAAAEQVRIVGWRLASSPAEAAP